MASMERVGWDSIKEGWKLYKNCPFYAIFERANANSGKTGRLIFSYKEGDREEGWELLQQNLQALEASAPTVPYLIQFYDEMGKKETIDSKTAHCGSFQFRMQSPVPGTVMGIAGVNHAADNSFLNYLQVELHREKEKNQELSEEIEELKEALDEASNQGEPKEIGGIIGQIGEAGNQFPWLAEIIKDGITILKNTLSAKNNAPKVAYGNGIAGVPDSALSTEKVNAAILKLVTWYTKEYGKEGKDEKEKQQIGFAHFANDMECLANISDDTDTMQLALKKLRAF